MSDWEGKDRRASNVSLQDILLEVRECRNDIGYLKSSFDIHLTDDKTSFSEIKKDVTFLQRCAFGLFGAWAFFQFLISSGAVNINNRVLNPNGSNISARDNSNAHVG